MGHHHGNHQLGHSPSQALSTQSNPSTPPFTLPPTATTSPSAFLHLALNTLETCEKHCLAAFSALPLAHLPKHSHNQTPTNHGCPGACRRPVIMSSRSSRVITCHHMSSRVITCHHVSSPSRNPRQQQHRVADVLVVHPIVLGLLKPSQNKVKAADAGIHPSTRGE